MEPNPSMSDDHMDVEVSPKKCFSLIQTRKFWAPLVPSTCRLCPSMDLIVLGMQPPAKSAAASSLWLHRTVSWQKLATLTGFEEPHVISHAGWSPDGRLLALGTKSGQVFLYHVEALASSSSSSTANLEGSSTVTQGRIHVIELPHGTIVGLTWAHVGRPHPNWKRSQTEVEEDISWRYRCRYLDRATTFLPPTAYHSKAEGGDSDPIFGESTAHIRSTIPTCKTPLSLLCVATAEEGIHLFLHGRYHILSLSHKAPLANPCNLVCSADLTHMMVQPERSSVLSIFSVPALCQHRYHLQTISALYCSISSHLEAIRQQSTAVAASWKSSLKPLDTKLEALVRLLKNYGVPGDIRSVLLEYTLVGHTSVSSDLCNAIDQFFTGVQMNDQLLQRMERSLQGAIANVESLVRKGLQSPAQALVYSVGELQGLARHVHFLLDEQAAQTLRDYSDILLVSIEYTLTQLVAARFRLRSFVAWLRSTGSQIKAQGTPANSVQRENAKKRRVPQAIVQEMMVCFQGESVDSNSLTERILCLPISALFRESPAFVSALPVSPISVRSEDFDDKANQKNTPTVVHATERVSHAADGVFDHPRRFLSKSVHMTEIHLTDDRQPVNGQVAVHTRIGSDGTELEDEDAENPGFFCPNVVQQDSFPEIPTFHNRQWAIVVRTDSKEGGIVDLFAIPLGGMDTHLMEDAEETTGGATEHSRPPYYLVSRLSLPQDYCAKDVAFYSQDGKSSLSSGVDSGDGKEGRQALAILTRNRKSTASQEVWLIQYDNLPYKPVLVGSDCEKVFLGESNIDLYQCETVVHPLPAGGAEDEMEHEGVVFARTRDVSVPDASTSEDEEKTSRLLMCGSRGVGGIYSTCQGVTTLELFDMEEDEEDDYDENEEGYED